MNSKLTQSTIFRQFFLIGFLISCQLGLYGQIRPGQLPKESAGQTIQEKMSQYNVLMPFEKLFLHTDKPYYSATDTIWFKAYLFNGLNNAYSSKSGLIYVELISGNTFIKRISVPAQIGLSWGQLALDETMASGDYTLRAYTNWMQNFGTESFFTKKIYIANQKEQKILVSRKQYIDSLTGKQMLNVDLQLKDLDNKNYGLKNLNWTILQGETVMAKKAIETTVDGKFKANITLPKQAKEPLRLILDDKTLLQRMVIPLSYSNTGDIDLQFMPEGGHLIAGLPANVAFKAIAENGLGTDVTGVITDSKNKEIVSFKSLFRGMGVFSLVPVLDEVYTAKITGKDGAFKSFRLPKIKPSGVNLKIVNRKESDSIHLTINFSEDLVSGQKYHLMAFVNGVTTFQTSFTAEKPRINAALKKSAFPSGIVHFTLFNDQKQPLTERMIFINNNDHISISVTSNKKVYKIRDSISLHINIKDKDGNTVPTASMSVSVTDNNQVKLDSLENNLVSNTFLASGLNGTIESPGYYFSNAANAAGHLDLLLLAQGWASYEWPLILNPQAKPSFEPEHEFTLSGEVANLSGKPLSGSKVIALLSGKTRVIMDTLTNSSGKFIFSRFPKLDTISFFVQALNTKDKKNNVMIQLNEFRPAKFYLKSQLQETPWYINTDTTILEFVKNDNRIKKQKFSLGGVNQLENVTINGKRGIKKSQNLNGRGLADQLINEEQVAAAGKVPLLQFILKNVTGIYTKISKDLNEDFYIGSRQVSFVIDGVNVKQFFNRTEGVLFYDYLKNLLDQIKLEEVTGIEVMNSTANVSNYDSFFDEDPGTVSAAGRNAYIEITTRSGKGMFFKSKQNVASYTPVPVNWPKEFYSPRYSPKNVKSSILDLRSTIFWQPHLLTSRSGEASASFYAADKPGIYTVIIQGSNLKGLVGYKTIKLEVR